MINSLSLFIVAQDLSFIEIFYVIIILNLTDILRMVHMYKYIIFDFDGTLVDSNDIIVSALQETAKRARKEMLSDKELDNILGKPLDIQVKSFATENVEDHVEFYRHYYRSHRDTMTKIFPGIKEMLDELKALGCIMGIVSNKGTSGLRHGIEMFGLEDYFEFVISAYDVVNRKPHPEPIYKALEILKADPHEALFIGDSTHDIECGKNASVKTVLVDWSILNKEILMASEPDYVIKDAKDLIDIVQRSI